MKQYVVDAFTERVFGGNPAAVCIIDSWLPDDLLSEITCENNLSETAFAVPQNGGYHLRWFTPGGEIDLCGHATLATAYVITNFIQPELTTVNFETMSGPLIVEKKGDLLEMDFPAYELKPIEVTDEMTKAIGVKPKKAYMGRDLLCIVDNEEIVRNITPDLEKVKELDGLLLHVSAQGKESDCVSRTFAPKLAVPEDPVCGSGHCHIVPYWANKLEKKDIVAYQASKRGGTLYCQMDGNRVLMAGDAALYSIAELYLPKND